MLRAALGTLLIALAMLVGAAAASAASPTVSVFPSPGTRAALPAAFLLVGLDDAPVRWEPHPGWLSTLFAALAAWCLSHRVTARWLLAASVSAALAYVFKQNTGVLTLAAIVIWAVTTRKRSLTAVLWPLMGFVAVSAMWLVPVFVAVRGDLSQLGVLVGALNQAGLFSGPEWPLLVPALCLAGGVWLWRRAGDQRLRWYVLAGSALLLTQIPRMDALHLVWSAPLLLVIGAVTLDRLRPIVAGAIVLGAGALCEPTIASRLMAVELPRVPIQDVRFAAGIDVPEPTRNDLQATLNEIQARTNSEEPIFVYPTSPLLYALAERPNPTRFDHLNPGAADARQVEQVSADLQAAGVRLVVVSDFWEAAWGEPGPNAPLEAWLVSHFTEVARYGAYRVLVSGL